MLSAHQHAVAAQNILQLIVRQRRGRFNSRRRPSRCAQRLSALTTDSSTPCNGQASNSGLSAALRSLSICAGLPSSVAPVAVVRARIGGGKGDRKMSPDRVALDRPQSAKSYGSTPCASRFNRLFGRISGGVGRRSR